MDALGQKDLDPVRPGGVLVVELLKRWTADS